MNWVLSAIRGVMNPALGRNPMMSLLPSPNQEIRLTPIMMCASVLWLSTSCDARNRDATPTFTVERPGKSHMPRFLPYELLVKFKSGISQERIEFILKDSRIDVIAEIQRGRLYHVKILGDRSVESALTQLSSYQEIEYAEPNYRYETQE
jgi:hypothetical protein